MTSPFELFSSRLQSRSLAILASLAMLLAGCTGSDNKNAGQPKAGSSNAGAAASASSPTKAGAKRIILLNNTDSPFWDAARAGIKKAQEDLKLTDVGFTASMDSNDGTETGQIEKLRQYGTQSDIAAVIISPISSTNPAIADELKKLKAKGITIGCFDSDLDKKFQEHREFYVGTNNIAGGKVLGTAAKMLKPNGAPYVQFVGVDSQQNAIERMDGFTSAVGDTFAQKDRKLDDADRNRARDNVRDVIAKYPDLSLLVGIWSYNAPAIVDVVKEKKARDKFTIVTFDAEAIAIQQMAEGMIDAMVVQNPFAMGYESVRYAYAKSKGDQETLKGMFPNIGQPGGDILDTGLKVVVPPGSPLKPEMFESFGKSVEFLNMPAFQDWLKKYDLTSS
ncbi:MAG: substrate-binding domain-containing protein [Pirellula sp.]